MVGGFFYGLLSVPDTSGLWSLPLTGWRASPLPANHRRTLRKLRSSGSSFVPYMGYLSRTISPTTISRIGALQLFCDMANQTPEPRPR